MPDTAPTIGHNAAPDDIAILRERLADEERDLIKRRDELVGAEARLPEIADDAVAGRVGDYIKLLSAATKAAEARRVARKEPFLAASRAVDGWYRGLVDPLTAIKGRVERKLTTFLQAKEAARRREEAAEAERLRAEAAAREQEAMRLAAANQPAAADAAIEKAAAVENQAVKAEEAAAAKPAELSRTRGEYGSVASLRQTWVGEIVDRATLDLEKLRPFIATTALQVALNGFVRAEGRECRGALIEQRTTATVA